MVDDNANDTGDVAVAADDDDVDGDIENDNDAIICDKNPILRKTSSLISLCCNK